MLRRSTKGSDKALPDVPQSLTSLAPLEDIGDGIVIRAIPGIKCGDAVAEEVTTTVNIETAGGTSEAPVLEELCPGEWKPLDAVYEGGSEGAMSEHANCEGEDAALRGTSDRRDVQCEDTNFQVVPEHAKCEDEGAAELEAWLRELDAGLNALLHFMEPLQREFGDLTQLAASVLPNPAGASVVDNVDPFVFEVLGARSLGHKLVLAKGICKLAGMSDM